MTGHFRLDQGRPTRHPTGCYAIRGDICKLYKYTIQITVFRQSGIPLTCAACEPAHNKGCCPLPKRLDTPGPDEMRGEFPRYELPATIQSS
jgi:hypothetical protein